MMSFASQSLSAKNSAFISLKFAKREKPQILVWVLICPAPAPQEKANITFYNFQSKNINNNKKSQLTNLLNLLPRFPLFGLMGCPNFIQNFHFNSLSAAFSGYT